jgi:hypothetical protein
MLQSISIFNIIFIIFIVIINIINIIIVILFFSFTSNHFFFPLILILLTSSLAFPIASSNIRSTALGNTAHHSLHLSGNLSQSSREIVNITLRVLFVITQHRHLFQRERDLQLPHTLKLLQHVVLRVAKGTQFAAIEFSVDSQQILAQKLAAGRRANARGGGGRRNTHR